MNVLVTGGAGYVGSIVTERLLEAGHHAIVLDNLLQGHRQAVLPEADFVAGDIVDINILESTFSNTKIDAVMHMAAETVVEYSMTDPRRYFHNNVVAPINLLDVMLKHGVNKFIFSSSAAVYGEPEKELITEDHPKSPVNSYGESKLMFERILGWYGRAYKLNHISLRYFNAAGASERLGEDHHPETHLIPNIFKAAQNGNPVAVFGSDYPTRDGSCVRDYVHVRDIAKAHLLALEKAETFSGAYNLGSGKGYTVLEVVEAVKRISGLPVPVALCPRRVGDPAVLVASSQRARSELGWAPENSLDAIIKSAWEWTKRHPNGYGGIP